MTPTLFLLPAQRRWLSALAIVSAIPLPVLAQEQQDSNQWECDANAENNPCMPPPERLDWVPWQQLDDEEYSLRQQRCGGSYADPLAGIDQSWDPSLADIEATASQSEMQGDTVRFSGGVVATQGYRSLRAERATINKVNRTGSLEGDVELREPGLLLRGASARLDAETGEAELTNSQFVIHDAHVRGGARVIRRRADEIIELQRAHYTYCPPPSDAWLLQAKELELDLVEGTATARNATIKMKGIPLFYTPYLSFPIDDRRRSGFLWPEVGKDSTGGLDFAIPYYFNLAPNYDATFTPRYIADRGLLSELELRYLGENLGYWELGGAWIGTDDKYDQDFPDKDGSRWLTAVEQHGLFNQRWRTEIDFTKTGDDQYFSDLGTTALEVKQSTHLAQRGELDYLGDNWLVQLRVEEFQTIARDIETDPYRKLPQLSVFRSTLPVDFQPNLILASDYSYFDHDTDPTGQRLYNELGVSYPMSWIWGFLKGEAKYRQLNYELDDAVFTDGKFDDSPAVGSPVVSVDGGLIFERDLGWGDDVYLHTLEPRVYYLWSDFEEQAGLPDFDSDELTFAYNQLYRNTRFSGHDRLDDANQASLGITTRIIDTGTGLEKFNASIGQIFFFDDRLVSLAQPPPERNREGSSAIAAEISLTPSQALDFRSSWLWNTDESELDQSYIQISYRGQNRRIFNLGYSYRRYQGQDPQGQNIDQVDLSTYFPVNNNWSIFLRSLYDLEDKDHINDMVGIEYNDCCWRLRLVHQRSLDQTSGANVSELVERDSATYVEFQLKGLGGLGGQVTSMLEEFIRGYEESND